MYVTLFSVIKPTVNIDIEYTDNLTSNVVLNGLQSIKYTIYLSFDNRRM